MKKFGKSKESLKRRHDILEGFGFTRIQKGNDQSELYGFGHEGYNLVIDFSAIRESGFTIVASKASLDYGLKVGRAEVQTTIRRALGILD